VTVSYSLLSALFIRPPLFQPALPACFTRDVGRVRVSVPTVSLSLEFGGDLAGGFALLPVGFASQGTEVCLCRCLLRVCDFLSCLYSASLGIFLCMVQKSYFITLAICYWIGGCLVFILVSLLTILVVGLFC